MARRRGRRQAAEETGSIQVAAWQQAGPGITLVAEPGPVKHVHFDGGGPAAARAPVHPVAEAAPEQPVAESAPLLLQEGATAPAPPARRWSLRRKVYETERGNKVLAEEVDGGRRFIVTSPHGERPFEPEKDVDPLIAGVAPGQRRVVGAAATAQSATVFAGRLPEARSVPGGAEHTYRIVVPATEATPLAPSPPPQASDAWEPDGLAVLREATRPARARPAVRPSRPRKAARPRRRTYRDFPGDDHLVADIEGIGPVFAKRLQKQGVHTTSRLCYEHTASLARRIKVPAATVAKWKAMAEFLKVKGLGPQSAEVLARSGVRGIDDLKSRSADKLAKTITAYLDGLESTVIGTSISAKRVAGWQKAARRLRRRALPIPPKGPPQTKTVRGHIQVLPKVGAKAPRGARRRSGRAARA